MSPSSQCCGCFAPPSAQTTRAFLPQWFRRGRVTATVTVAFVALASADPDERGDFWLDADSHFAVTAAADASLDAKTSVPISADTSRKFLGDSSVRAEMAALNSTPTAAAACVVLHPGAGRAAWHLDRTTRWQAAIARAGAPATGSAAWSLVVVDTEGHVARSVPQRLASDDGWHLVDLRFDQLNVPAGFAFARVARVALVFDDGRPATVWLDAVRFLTAGREIALTDQLTADRMQEEIATRATRLASAFEKVRPAGASQKNKRADLFELFTDFWLNRDVARANRDLLAILESKDTALRARYGLEYTWALTTTPMLYRFYFNFGRTSKRFPGRLTAATEKAILETLWERNQFKNDIHLTRQSTWNLTGSENHDINAKVGCLLTSQIFMHEPDFAERVYPNLGTGAGYGYWFHRTEQTGRFHGPQGRATRTDFADHRAREHNHAWAGFLQEYLRERARRGFFVERASPSYMKYTMSFLQDLYDYTEDAELKRMTGLFLDLVWADWAQDQLNGLRGGAKTRVNDAIPDYRGDPMRHMATFMFGGPALPGGPLISFWLSEYRPPRVVWNLALNRAVLGDFAYVSRSPGEEPGVLPRPLGMERTLICDTDSRLVRYSWVTPDYVLGTQMDHPLAIHSHLSVAARLQGMIFGSSPARQVFARAVAVRPNGRWVVEAKDGGMYRSLQSGPVLITQQSRGFTVINPEWFPGGQGQEDSAFGLYFSPALSRVEEDQGWIFVEEGPAYLAVRPAAGVLRASVDTTTDTAALPGADTVEEPLDPKAYDWSPDRTILKLKDRHSPLVFEAGRRTEFATLVDFKRHILGNKLVLQKHTVPGWYTVHYASRGHEYIFNSAATADLPTIDGRAIDYAPARTFDSPYLRGDYRKGVVTVSDTRTQLTLDLERNERRESPLPR